ncbi:hypothetical protein BV22DRAFT_1041136 [Leucogyrophana mollusca]|uniref:Uncharacterized protein n=1 Tax=Leucogyrophana mollusca TaxID=85980 RepID=A0ACB8B3A2_9AGAM|nr:hypothetical protein BV22DRAFT_1041136 [Leucogyrophana mollusca]
MSATMTSTMLETVTAEPEWISDEPERIVRFDAQCVLIPESSPRQHKPRMVTRSFSLPLWKRRASAASGTPGSPEKPDPFSTEENHVVLRVPIPRFAAKPQPHPPRNIDPCTLSPCLVHRDRSPTSPTFPRGSPPMHRRNPRTPSPSLQAADLMTVPLRPCCTACLAITEASLSQGDHWPEHFSRAARRRRSLSADAGPRTITVEGSVAAATLGLGHPGRSTIVPISVDEVDKRRRSSDSGPSKPESVWLNDEISCPHLSSPGITSPPRPTRGNSLPPPSTPRIPEEEDDDDEDQLFPLPSPRRTPCSSPASSPYASASSLNLGQAQSNPSGSPANSNCSGESSGSCTGKNGLLCPPVPGSTSSLCLPKNTGYDTAVPDELPRAPSPNLLATLPSISARRPSRSPSPRISHTPPSPPAGPRPLFSSASAPSVASARSPSPTHPSPRAPSPIRSFPSAPIPIPLNRSHSEIFHSPEPAPRSPGLLSRSPSLASRSPEFSSSISPSSSPNTKKQKLRGSFSMARPRHIIADVLRGVGAMGGAGGSIGAGVRV